MSNSSGIVTFGSETIPYKVQLLTTRRTLGIEVHPNLQVLVRAPVDCDPTVIAEKVRQRAPWISKQLAAFQRFSPRTPPRQFVSGETHLYLGRQYRLKVRQGSVSSVKLTRGQLIVTSRSKMQPQQVKTILQRWYRARAREIFEEILVVCSHSFARRGHSQPRLAVKNMHTRWGSLSSSGLVTLNGNLIHAPKSCIEYVIIHELCHLEHKNHGPKFYRLLEQLMPDWLKRKRRLEEVLL
ncbi:MAG: M48 family metallopeptidase [Candidatus Binatia bacterium]